MPDENEPLNADLLRRNESNRRINTILQALRTAPFADRIGIVGSVARGKLTPVDLDIVVDVSDRRFEGPGQLSDFAVLLQLSHKFYGYLDPFILFSNRMVTRDDTARSWVVAKGAKAMRIEFKNDRRALAEQPDLPVALGHDHVQVECEQVAAPRPW